MAKAQALNITKFYACFKWLILKPMFAFFLVAVGTLLMEGSSTMGKKAVAKRSETLYSFGFLNYFWSCLVMLGLVLLGADFHFSRESLPFFLPRLVLEVVFAQLALRAIIRSDRSTFAFLRLITIPLIIVVDVIVGYPLNATQILGSLLIFGALVALLSEHALKTRGGKDVVLVAILATATLSLYKYDITHFNSVAAEQLLVFLVLLAYFTIAGWEHHKERTWKYLLKPRQEAQSLLHGVGVAAFSFAYYLAPASVIATLNRAFTVLWSIIFGNIYFHEKNLGFKIGAWTIASLGLMLIVLNS